MVDHMVVERHRLDASLDGADPAASAFASRPPPSAGSTRLGRGLRSMQVASRTGLTEKANAVKRSPIPYAVSLATRPDGGGRIEGNRVRPVRGPDVLRLRDVDRPAPKDDQVLVRVHAASTWRSTGIASAASQSSCATRKDGGGRRTAARARLAGPSGGRRRRDESATEATKVIEMNIRTLAEYAAVSVEGSAETGGALTFQQAAAVPLAALTAVQACCARVASRPARASSSAAHTRRCPAPSSSRSRRRSRENDNRLRSGRNVELVQLGDERRRARRAVGLDRAVVDLAADLLGDRGRDLGRAVGLEVHPRPAP